MLIMGHMFSDSVHLDIFYWMPTLWIPIKTLKLCSGMKLSFLETFWSFWVLFLKFVRQEQNSVKSAVNFSSLLRQTPFDYFTQCWLVGTGNITGLVRYIDTVPFNPFRWGFPQVHAIFSYTCAVCYLTESPSRTLDIQGTFSVLIPTLWYPLLWMVPSLVPLDSQLCFPTQGFPWTKLPTPPTPLHAPCSVLMVVIENNGSGA